MACRIESKVISSVIAAMLICAAQAAPGRAQETKRTLASAFSVDEADPEASVPTPAQALKNPLEMGYFLMDLSDLAEAAQKKGNYAQVVKLYRAMAKAVPDRSLPYTRQCEAYEAMNDLASALSACKQALAVGGVTADDHAHFVRLVLEQKGTLAAKDIEDVDAIVSHLESTAAADATLRLLAAQLGCELGARLQDEKRLLICTNKLSALAPTDARTFGFQWTLALQRRDYAAAARVIERAQVARVPAEVIGRMQQGLATMQKLSTASDRFASVFEPTWFAMFGSAFVLGLCVLAWALHKRNARQSA